METNWAVDHLQTIRTLMERSAVYRRALAPIMTCVGLLGLGGAALGLGLNIGTTMDGERAFILLWGIVALTALSISFLLVRRQALKDAEPFWSPPTRRVANAMTPALFLGGFLAGLLYWGKYSEGAQFFLPPLWMGLYGCALHAAGFFMPRGIKLLGWAFVFAACLVIAYLFYQLESHNSMSANCGHICMGLSFGLLQLLYGIYLYFTEQRRNET